MLSENQIIIAIGFVALLALVASVTFALSIRRRLSDMENSMQLSLDHQKRNQLLLRERLRSMAIRRVRGEFSSMQLVTSWLHQLQIDFTDLQKRLGNSLDATGRKQIQTAIQQLAVASRDCDHDIQKLVDLEHQLRVLKLDNNPMEIERVLTHVENVLDPVQFQYNAATDLLGVQNQRFQSLLDRSFKSLSDKRTAE